MSEPEPATLKLPPERLARPEIPTAPTSSSRHGAGSENLNQFKLPIPLDPLNTAYTLCKPLAPETVPVTVCHVCQPPVTGMLTEPINGPPALSKRNSNVPPLPALATRAFTDDGLVAKFTFRYTA